MFVYPPAWRIRIVLDDCAVDPRIKVGECVGRVRVTWPGRSVYVIVAMLSRLCVRRVVMGDRSTKLCPYWKMNYVMVMTMTVMEQSMKAFRTGLRHAMAATMIAMAEWMK